jgi:hypothetical protein
MTLARSVADLPDGDLKIEVEHVLDGWVSYVWLTPVHGAIVPASRESVYARTDKYPTREAAIAALPQALSRIKEKMAGAGV